MARMAAQACDGGFQVARRRSGSWPPRPLFAFAHALQHLDMILTARAKLDLARLVRPSSICTNTILRVPLSMTAESRHGEFTGWCRPPAIDLRIHGGLR